LRRTCIVELIVDEETEKKLRRLCELSSKLWNEINYTRLKAWMEKKGIDFDGTYKEFYEKCKPLIGSATAQIIIRKNDGVWRGFFELLKLKKEGKLPPFVKKISPPGYKKRKSRALWVVLRKDQCEVSDDKIVLKYLGTIGRIEVKYRGIIHLRGERGGIEIRYDADRGKWYASIAFDVSEKMVRGEWRPVPKQPRGNLMAGIDIGINNLMAIYVENGLTKLVNGRPLKAISHYWRGRITEYQSMLNKYGLKTSKKLRQMYTKWRRQIRHYINAKVREAVEWLYNVGVSKVKIGYPKGLAQENGDFNNVHIWTYGYLLRRIAEVAEEYSISVIYVDETGTSTKCPIHGDGCGIRVYRGLFRCTRLNEIYNADIAAAYNILKTQITEDANNPRASKRGGGNGRRPGQGLNPQKRGDVAQTSPYKMGRRSIASLPTNTLPHKVEC
jgi:putative transposase